MSVGMGGLWAIGWPPGGTHGQGDGVYLLVKCVEILFEQKTRGLEIFLFCDLLEEKVRRERGRFSNPNIRSVGGVFSRVSWLLAWPAGRPLHSSDHSRRP